MKIKEDKNDTLKDLIRSMLKNIKEESYYTEYGEGYKAGKIEIVEILLKLIQ